ncbi:deoxyribose-phosphate aldolase [Petrotoga sp. HWH.PT.55.6.1]|uniref:deoxyribose-phosphate aldolase n=1 Tax=unclassified Petrotoga TaxID=2620614 RepID=UPI000CA0871D|nr:MULTISPECIES: deoxyribose-phosphate aldolase [unclassified Petrotoga]PNR90734.1 deoxyribose-phosphate aldolase [Petrotoga sp. HWHPT.55.6.3]RPD35971.1 deoxyribose-phosphate aldolase [Petrotoga sp. HWH.PT.55.6.1]
MKLTKKEVAKTIDHTLLKPNATLGDIERLCKEAKEFGFVSVAIAPYFVKYANELLGDSEVKVGVAVGFPFGYNTTATKVFETKESIVNGAKEVDMVVNISAVKDRKWEIVKEDIESVAKECKNIVVLKVIFETCYLEKEEIKKLAEVCLQIPGVDYIKTSTGFGPSGATVEDVKLMKETVGNKIKVKAAGGIRTLQDYINMINAGAERIGTSSGISILKELSE